MNKLTVKDYLYTGAILLGALVYTGLAIALIYGRWW